MSTTYEVPLLRCEDAADQRVSFYFRRPDGFNFRAGQFVDITLGTTDGQEDSRSFSMATPPSEDILMITTRIRQSASKQQLAKLDLDQDVSLDGPLGSFVLGSEVPRPLVLIAGGVGITPFRNILYDLAHAGRLDEVYLFYSNRTPEGAAFLAELTQMHEVPGRFTLVPTMTGLSEADRHWKGEVGRISPEMITRYVQPQIATHYVAGPPTMVDATRGMLAEMGVERNRVRAERFSGYDK